MYRAGLRGFVCYDSRGKLVPSSLVLRNDKPKLGDWVEVPMRLDTFPHPLSRTSFNRGFIRYDQKGWIVAGSLKLSRSVPSIGNWYEVPMSISCLMCTTTSTTTEFPN